MKGPMASLTNTTPGGASAGGVWRVKTLLGLLASNFRPGAGSCRTLPAEDFRIDRAHEGVHAVEALRSGTGRQPFKVAVPTAM